MSLNINYTKGVVICHGKSEICLSKYISSNLHLSIKPYSNNHGKNSIQITSLKTILNSYPFKNINTLLKEYDIETSGKGPHRVLQNFKLFIIMDTDDCSEQQREEYISKELFKGYWLYEYIVPIYNINKLEEVLQQSGIMTKKIRTNEKGEYYEKIFPINSKPLSNDTLNEVNTFRSKIEKVTTTNLECFIDYCLSLLETIK